MMTKETWITAGTAAKILEERFGRPIRVDYVTRLGSLGRLRKQDVGSRIVLYHRHDVEQVQIRERKKPSPDDGPQQIELLTAHEVTSPSVEEKLISAMPLPEVSQNRNVEASSDILPKGQPEGTMKLKEYADDLRVKEADLRKWLTNGVEGDRLEFSQYMNKTNRPTYCFTPDQQQHNVEVLRKHGKVRDSGSDDPT